LIHPHGKIFLCPKVIFCNSKIDEGKRSSYKFPPPSPPNVIIPLPTHWVETYVISKKNLVVGQMDRLMNEKRDNWTDRQK